MRPAAVSIFLLAALLLCLAAVAGALSPLPKLTVQGKHLVDPDGNPVRLQGTNLGNWLILEMWMLCLTDGPTAIDDQHEFLTILRDRFGEEEAERLMDAYRANWITERDFAVLRDFGFNLVRLPMDYRLMEDDRRPMELRPDAWEWIDRAVDLAEAYGIYIILDMHGVQGGQSVFDHTGHAGQNRLWSDPQAQERLVWLWGEVAERYKDRDAVVAYDVINEPYGGDNAGQVAIFSRLYDAIRERDPETLIYAPAHYTGFAHYGDPAENGWVNVGFTEHHYPGLFGNGDPTLTTHARFLRYLESLAVRVDALNVPFLVGEMNVVFDDAGGAAMMRRYWDAHAAYGWQTTMWSYKVLSTDGGFGSASWAVVTNPDPVRRVDLRRASKEEIEDYLVQIGHTATEPKEDLRQMLTSPNPELPPIPEIPAPRRRVSFDDSLPGWTRTDLGGALPGGLAVGEEGLFALFGGGEDIWSFRDQAGFLHRRAEGDFTLEVTVGGIEDFTSYIKAGLMARSSLEPDAATFLLSVFSNGEMQVAVRPGDGLEMQGQSGVPGGLPLRLRLQRRGDLVTGSFLRDGEWVEVGRTALAGSLEVGPVALSHDDTQLVEIRYRDLTFGH